jgi:predicted RecB family endonuclease
MAKVQRASVNWKALTPVQRGQLVRDLNAAVRVFQLLEDVGPEFLASLTKRSLRHSGKSRAADAQTVIEELIAELAKPQSALGRPLKLKLVR